MYFFKAKVLLYYDTHRVVVVLFQYKNSEQYTTQVEQRIYSVLFAGIRTGKKGNFEKSDYS
jgi:hypothetical protein